MNDGRDITCHTKAALIHNGVILFCSHEKNAAAKFYGCAGIFPRSGSTRSSADVLGTARLLGRSRRLGTATHAQAGAGASTRTGTSTASDTHVHSGTPRAAHGSRPVATRRRLHRGVAARRASSATGVIRRPPARSGPCTLSHRIGCSSCGLGDLSSWSPAMIQARDRRTASRISPMDCR